CISAQGRLIRIKLLGRPVPSGQATAGATMTPRYRHTQPGTFTLIAMTVAALLAAWIGYLNAGAAERWPAWAVAIVLAVVACLFSSLTVEVSEEEVRWHFGPGLWRYRIARGEIAG